jgi:hypothetical protein
MRLCARQSTCRARLLEGEVAYPNGRPLGLSDTEADDGLVLLCRAHARSDLLLETFEPGTADAPRIKRLPCRVERIERLGHDVVGVYLRLPPAESFDFKPGQYVDVLLSKGRRRSFSIASPPHDARPLELHVRRAPGGEFSEQVFAEEMRGAVLHLEGPLGNSAYRETAGTRRAGWRRAECRRRASAAHRGRHRACAAQEHPAPCAREGLASKHGALLGCACGARSVRACFSGRGGTRPSLLALRPCSLRAVP